MQVIIIDEPGYLRTLVAKIKEAGYDALYLPRWKSDLAKMKPDVLIANTYKPLHHLNHVLAGMSQSLYNIVTDMEYTQKFMRVLGIQTPTMHIANQGVVSMEMKDDIKYAIDSHTFPSYFNKGVEDAKAVLSLLNELHIVQQVREVPYSFEVEIEGWFNGKEIMNPPYLILDSVIMRPLPRENLYNETLGKIEDALKKINFKGPISMRVGVDKENVYGLSLDCKFRPMVLESLKRPADVLRAVVTGASNKFPIYWGWTEQVPLVCDVSLLNCKLPLPILGLNEQNKKHLWLLRDGKDEKYIYTGKIPIIGYITSTGETVRECNRRVERTRSNLIIPFTLAHPVAHRVQEREKLMMEWHLL